MKLAIVIPYYKHTFFEATLLSLQNQTNKQFNVYIGDDASPDDPQILLEKYNKSFVFHYKRFTSNLGGHSLTQQWERCLELCNDEEWVLFLCDDDVLGDNCIASFYENLKEITDLDTTVVRFASKIIDGANNSLSEVYKHPKIEKATDFLIRKLGGGTRSSLSEYIFRKELVTTIGFRDLPLAWYSDLLAVLEFSRFGMLFTINNAVLYFRWSGENITSKTDDLLIKNKATFYFYYHLLQRHHKELPLNLKRTLFDKLEKTMLENKKKGIYWVKLFYLYLRFFEFRRFLSLSLKIKKSIK